MGAHPEQPRTETSHAATRAALLEAAADVFAEVGFHHATVRDICGRAGANVAAVNYHFGDKDALYREVLGACHQVALEKYPPDLGLPADASPEARLHAFVRSLLLRITSCGRHSRHGRLISRELTEPTGALDSIVASYMRPMSEALVAIVRALAGRPVPDEEARLCALSVVSQALFYHQCTAVVSRLYPELALDPTAPDLARLEQLARHITDFSLAGIHARLHPATPPTPPTPPTPKPAARPSRRTPRPPSRLSPRPRSGR